MQGTPRERAGSNGQVRGGVRKLACTSVNNIRDSGYKIARSRSNRTDHSLSTKKPISLAQHAQSLSKQRLQAIKDAPQTPINCRRRDEKHGKTAQTCTALHETLSGDKSRSNMQAPSNNKQESSVPIYAKMGGYELDCLQAIWQNSKILKGCELFASELRQLQIILQKMVFKLAQQENCLTTNRQNIEHQKPPLKRHQLKATSDTQNIFSDRVQQLFQQTRLNCIIENRESVKSSYGSLKIENQDSHKWEYLDMYTREREEEMEGTLKDITNSCRVDSQHSHSNSLSSNDKGSTFRREEKGSTFGREEKGSTFGREEKGSTFGREEKAQWEDKIYLRSIVKRKRQAQSKAALNGQDCCQKREMSNQSISYQCHLFECDAMSRKEAPSSGSSGSSQSKREVLNQIISMLNRKYQRNLKCQGTKVFI